MNKSACSHNLLRLLPKASTERRNQTPTQPGGQLDSCLWNSLTGNDKFTAPTESTVNTEWSVKHWAAGLSHFCRQGHPLKPQKDPLRDSSTSWEGRDKAQRCMSEVVGLMAASQDITEPFNSQWWFRCVSSKKYTHISSTKHIFL